MPFLKRAESDRAITLARASVVGDDWDSSPEKPCEETGPCLAYPTS